jgi:hypothetical protein
VSVVVVVVVVVAVVVVVVVVVEALLPCGRAGEALRGTSGTSPLP